MGEDLLVPKSPDNEVFERELFPLSKPGRIKIKLLSLVRMLLFFFSDDFEVINDTSGDDFGRMRFLAERCPCNVVSFFLFNIRFNDDRDEGRVVDTVFDNFVLFLTGLNFVLNFIGVGSISFPELEFGLELDFLLCGRLPLCDELGRDKDVLLPPLLLGRFIDDDVDGLLLLAILLLLFFRFSRDPLDEGAVCILIGALKCGSTIL